MPQDLDVRRSFVDTLRTEGVSTLGEMIGLAGGAVTLTLLVERLRAGRWNWREANIGFLPVIIGMSSWALSSMSRRA